MNRIFPKWIYVSIIPCLLLWSAAGYPDEPVGDPLGNRIIKITAPAPKCNKRKGTCTTRLILTNRTKKRKPTIFLDSLAVFVTPIGRPDVTLANAAGRSSDGRAYVTVPLSRKMLQAGQRTRPFRLTFNSPNPKKKFRVSYAVYRGVVPSGNVGGGSGAIVTDAATGSGAIGVLATNRARVAFIPDRASVRPVLLEGVPGVVIDSNTNVLLSFNADGCTVDPIALKAICIGYAATRIALLDIADFSGSLKTSDIRVSEFDSGAPNVKFQFSGAGCVLCGVVADPDDRRFVVAANDGYRVYPYDSMQPTVFNIPINENFSLDSARDQITAAEYEPDASGKRALRIVDLNQGTVYRWTGSTASCADLQAGSSTCAAGREVDATTVDPVTKIVALIFEHSTAVAMVDMAQAVFDKTASTFNAPVFYTEAPTGRKQSGGAATTTGNYLFTAEEASGGPSSSPVGVLRLPSTAGTGGLFPGVTPNPVYIDLADVPNPECAGAGSSAYRFVNKGDPHGLAVYTSLIGGRQTGLVVDFPTDCVGLVDLPGLLDATRDPANSAAVAASVDLRATGIVRFIKLN